MRYLHRMLAAVAALVLTVGLGGPTAARAAGSGLEQTVTADEAVAHDQVERGAGHLDLGPRFLDDRWTLMVRDDTAAPPTWRHPNDLLIRVNDQATMQFPGGKDYDFVGIPAGSDVYVVPQTQQQGVVWLGWNTQHPTTTDSINQRAQLVLHGVEGPGALKLFLQNGFGAPEALWDSAKSGDQALSMELNTHVHANWVFTKPGVYLIDVSAVAQDNKGTRQEDRQTLRFAVGDAVSTADAFAVQAKHTAAPATTASGASVASAAADADAAEAPKNSWLGWVLGGSALAVVVVAGLLLRGVLVARRERAAAEAESAGESGSTTTKDSDD